MLTVDDVRAIARTFHHSRRKVREVIVAIRSQKPYARSCEPVAGKLFHPIIQQILADARRRRPSSGTRVGRIFEQLHDEHGYAGGYDAVRRYVGKTKRQHVETFIPLTRDPGQRLEADFGHIYVDFPEGRKQVAVLMLVWSHSNCPFGHGIAKRANRSDFGRHGAGDLVLREHTS